MAFTLVAWDAMQAYADISDFKRNVCFNGGGSL